MLVPTSVAVNLYVVPFTLLLEIIADICCSLFGDMAPAHRLLSVNRIASGVDFQAGRNLSGAIEEPPARSDEDDAVEDEASEKKKKKSPQYRYWQGKHRGCIGSTKKRNASGFYGPVMSVPFELAEILGRVELLQNRDEILGMEFDEYEIRSDVGYALQPTLDR